MKTIYIDKPDHFTAAIFHAAFPNYNGKKWKLDIVSGETEVNLSSYWSGGSRDQHVIVRLGDLKAVAVDSNGYLGKPSLKLNSLPSGHIVVTHSIFCGKDSGLTITAIEADVAPLLPKQETLTRQEQIVLVFTRSLKASYAGISNYRFKEAKSATGITHEAWETAKASLIQKGLLNKAGAITPNGKNACPNKQTFEFN